MHTNIPARTIKSLSVKISKTLEIFRFYDNEGTIYCNNVASFKL